jgi:Holliday junction resolvasome RuvABC endonuclease subunit
VTLVVGLDLSLTSTGVCVATPDGIVTDTVTSKGTKADTWTQRGERLRALRREITRHVGDPTLVVVEAPSYGSTGGSAHDRGGLWWLIVSTLQAREIPVGIVTPKCRAKYATGNGNADKLAVAVAASKRFPHLEIPTHDEADALWLAAMGMAHLGAPLVELPKTHLDALKAVAWPVGVSE